MQNLIDEMATTDRSKNATRIWNEVHQAIQTKYPNKAVHMMTKKETVQRVHYSRHGAQSSDRLRDIEQPDLALTTNGMLPFLAFNTPIYQGIIQHRITGFGHPGLFKILKSRNVHIFVDSTYRIVPNPFKQLMIIMVRETVNDLYLPCFYVLMTGKTSFLYQIAFQMVTGLLGTLIQIGSVCCDFEQALIKAIKGIKSVHYFKF